MLDVGVRVTQVCVGPRSRQPPAVDGGRGARCAEDLDVEVSRERRSGTQTFTRRWVVWHLVEHDLHHGGEISQTLGTHGLPGLDL